LVTDDSVSDDASGLSVSTNRLLDEMQFRESTQQISPEHASKGTDPRHAAVYPSSPSRDQDGTLCGRHRSTLKTD